MIFFALFFFFFFSSSSSSSSFLFFFSLSLSRSLSLPPPPLPLPSPDPQHQHRSDLWVDLVNHWTVGVRKFKGDNYYQRLLAHKEGKESVATKQIELDLLRTFPTNKYFNDLGAEVAVGWYSCHLF